MRYAFAAAAAAAGALGLAAFAVPAGAQSGRPQYSDTCELPDGRTFDMDEEVQVGSACFYEEDNGRMTRGVVVPPPAASIDSASGRHAVPAQNARRAPRGQ